jgi:peptidoglycan/LPS O-acetylase OafA/YrhL
MSKKSVYFENLNGLRFIAAFLVIIHHIEQLKNIMKLPSYWANPMIKILGSSGVILFFALSGFLITYLLYVEKEVTLTIDLKKFYIRRILRIWPLYFIIVFLSLFIFPYINFLSITGLDQNIVHDHLIQKIILFVFFAPNLVLVIYGVIPFASQTWSIGVEEQFYLIWPVLNKYVKNKLLVIMGLLLGFILLKYILIYMPYSNILLSLYELTPMGCMAIGALFAYIAYENNRFTTITTKILFRKEVQIITTFILSVLIIYGFHFQYLDKEIYAFLFGILIINFAMNKKCLVSLENKIFNYLGKISYGLYMYHLVAILICLKFLMHFNLVTNYYLYPTSILLTIIIASLSYFYIEKAFIKLKTKYSQIISGESLN